METALGLGGFQFAIFLNRYRGKTVLHLDDQHLVDAADGEGRRPPRRVRHLPGRLDGVVQQVPQNRAQIHAADIGAAGKLHLDLEPNTGRLRCGCLAVDQVVRRLVPCPDGGSQVPHRGLQFIQVADSLPVLLMGEELPQDADVVVEVVEQLGVDLVGPVDSGIVPLQQLGLLRFQLCQLLFHLILPVDVEHQHRHHQHHRQNGPHIEGVVGNRQNGLLRQCDDSEESCQRKRGDGPERRFAVDLPASGEPGCQNGQQPVEQPEGGLSGQRSGAQKVLGAEQHAHPCRQEKRPERDADLIKDADKQAHSQFCPLQPVGAGGNQHRLQSHSVEIRRMEQG